MMVYLKNALMCIKRQINHDCLPTLMQFYVVLYIMFAYLMLFAALSNAAFLHNAFPLISIFCKCFLFHALS